MSDHRGIAVRPTPSSPLAGRSCRSATSPATPSRPSTPRCGRCTRLIVVGTDADLAAVLTRLLRIERLDVEVGPRGRRVADGAGAHAAARAACAADPRRNRPGHRRRRRLAAGDDGAPLHGEAIVDDTVLFDGEVTGVRIEPTTRHARPAGGVLTGRLRRRRWVTGRAAQLGTTGARVLRDGVGSPARCADRRSTGTPRAGCG